MNEKYEGQGVCVEQNLFFFFFDGKHSVLVNS